MLPLVVIFGPTASGKTALAMALAERFGGEILSCDSVAVYRRMELGTAKPTMAERARIPHHLLDLYEPNEASTAGGYARLGREALARLARRGVLPIVAGGTGLYLRALVDGLSPAPPRDPELRDRLQARGARRGPGYLHRLLARLDPQAAQKIHANDVAKVIRAVEVSLSVRRPMTEQWGAGRDALTGYRILRVGLDPPRAQLAERIDRRAESMFRAGLVEEIGQLVAEFGRECRPLRSLGYAQAAAVLDGTLTLEGAVAAAQKGHRHYAKRQRTWFRGEAERHPVHWLQGTGDAEDVVAEAVALVESHLQVGG